jgi:hypothetical protein
MINYKNTVVKKIKWCGWLKINPEPGVKAYACMNNQESEAERMLGREREAQPHLPCNHGMVAFLMTTMLFE